MKRRGESVDSPHLLSGLEADSQPLSTLTRVDQSGVLLTIVSNHIHKGQGLLGDVHLVDEVLADCRGAPGNSVAGLIRDSNHLGTISVGRITPVLLSGNVEEQFGSLVFCLEGLNGPLIDKLAHNILVYSLLQ